MSPVRLQGARAQADPPGGGHCQPVGASLEAVTPVWQAAGGGARLRRRERRSCNAGRAVALGVLPAPPWLRRALTRRDNSR